MGATTEPEDLHAVHFARARRAQLGELFTRYRAAVVTVLDTVPQGTQDRLSALDAAQFVFQEAAERLGFTQEDLNAITGGAQQQLVRLLQTRAEREGGPDVRDHV